MCRSAAVSLKLRPQCGQGTSACKQGKMDHFSGRLAFQGAHEIQQSSVSACMQCIIYIAIHHVSFLDCNGLPCIAAHPM
jgi:hypothetical protein